MIFNFGYLMFKLRYNYKFGTEQTGTVAFKKPTFDKRS